MNAYSRAPAGQALAQALDLLGWSGHLVVQARALSEPRLVACTWDQPAHDRRAGAGILPVTDPLLLRCALSEPRFRAAPVPARITGAIAIRRTWRAAVSNLTGFAAFGALVAVLPDAQASRLEVTAEASVTGIGVIGAGQARLVQHPDLRPRPGTGTWVHRLVAEIIYDAALAARAGHAGLPAAFLADLRRTFTRPRSGWQDLDQAERGTFGGLSVRCDRCHGRGAHCWAELSRQVRTLAVWTPHKSARLPPAASARCGPVSSPPHRSPGCRGRS
jgi:hypothetical protein